MIRLIYGGSGSGKSEAAEQMILSCSRPEQRFYIATMIAYGEEGRQKVLRHTALRQGKGFVTLECPTDLKKTFDRIPSPEEAAVLIECVSNLTANEMFENHLGEEKTAHKVVADIRWLCSRVKEAVIVTNNIFEDGMEYAAETMAYVHALGSVNRGLAALADEVYEVTAGIPARIGHKKEAHERSADCEHNTAADRNFFACDRNTADERRSNMKLVIGGTFQGKLEYVLSSINTPYCLIDETNFQADPDPYAAETETVIVNHLHLIIRACGQQETACSWIRDLEETCAAKGQELILISDEVGNGVIPLDKEDRQFREDTGRILCSLAKEAGRVERILCGLPQILK